MTRMLSLRAAVVALALPFTHAGGAIERHATIAKSLQLTDVPAKETVRRIADTFGLEIRAYWDDGADSGLASGALVSLPARAMTPAAIIEAALRQCDSGVGGGATWQIAEDGAIQLGPRSRLNETLVVRIYDVRDLLTEAPEFNDGATIDLTAALQAQGGSVLREHPQELPRPHREDAQDELISLIVSTVEPEQWEIAGGPASLRFHRGQLVVRAPGYVLRQLAGMGRF